MLSESAMIGFEHYYSSYLGIMPLVSNKLSISFEKYFESQLYLHRKIFFNIKPRLSSVVLDLELDSNVLTAFQPTKVTLRHHLKDSQEIIFEER